MGTVQAIIYKHGDSPPALPIAVVVMFEKKYIGPSIITGLPRCVPVVPVTNASLFINHRG